MPISAYLRNAHQHLLRRPAHPARSRLRGAAVLAGVAVLSLVGPTASAHDELVSTNPPDGTQVDVVPGQIELVFNDVPLSVGAEVQVTGPNGDVVSVESAQVLDTSVIQPVAPDLPAGAYRVLWRVTSADGHPLSGEFSFTATTGAVVAVEPSAEPSPTASSSPTPAATAGPEAAPAVEETGAAADEESGSSTGGARIGIGLAAVAAVAGAIVVVWRRLRRPTN